MGFPYAEVIGDPIAHSKSPLIHNFWLRKLGVARGYLARQVKPDELPGYLDERRADPNWRGCNVTMPLKCTILPLLDRLEPEAEGAGAANTVIRTPDGMLGLNTDVLALRDELLEPADTAALMGEAVVVIGTGGAARAVLQVLREVKDVELALLSRNRDKAERLLSEFGLRGTALPVAAPLPATELIINASSLGMTGCPDLRLALPPSGATVVDLVYSPVETWLLRAARARGLPTVDGLTILLGQASHAFSLFFSYKPPAGCEEELREVLTR